MDKYKRDTEKQDIIQHNIRVAKALGYNFYVSDGAYRYDCDVDDYVRRSTTLCRVSMKAATILSSTIWSYGVDTVKGVTNDKHDYIEQLDSLMPKIIRTLNDFGFCAIRINDDHIIELLAPPHYLIVNYDDYTFLERTNELGDIDINIVTNGSKTIIKEMTTNLIIDASKDSKHYFIISGGINKASISMAHDTWQEQMEYFVKQNMKTFTNPPAEIASNYVEDSTQYNMLPGGVNRVNPRPDTITARISPLLPPEITQQFIVHDQYNKSAISEIYDLDLLVSENWITATRGIANKIYQMIKKIFPKDDIKFHSLVSSVYNSAVILSSEKVVQTIAQLAQLDPSTVLLLDTHKFINDTANSLNVFTDMLVSEDEFRNRVAAAQAQAQRQQDLTAPK